MSISKKIRALFIALGFIVACVPRANAGFSLNLPPGAISVGSDKRSNIFYVGEPVVLKLSATAARYEVRDYYGTLVDQNNLQGTTFTVNVTNPGWYKVYVYGNTDQGAPWGQTVGGTMFVIFRNKAGFPALPQVDPNASQFVDDEAIRGVTGMGPQRHYVLDASNPDADIARLQQEIAVDKQMYLPYDPVRSRSLLIAFPNGTSDIAGVTKVVNTFKNDVKYFEPRNEPNFTYSGTDFVNEMKTFYQTVKSVDPGLKVVGPGIVTIGPYGLGWIEDFLKAGGGNYIDVFSFHAYNNVNGDPFLCIHSLEQLNVLLQRYNLGNIEQWQTEQGYMAAVYGSFQPRLQGRWTMLQMMIFEQYGIPKEHNHLWYDKSRGYWDEPMWWENDDSSLMPAPALMRVWSEELYGTKFAKAYTFGDSGDELYLGSLFSGPGKSVATFMSGGSTDGHVDLAVSGGNSIHYVTSFGLEYDMPITAGRVTIPVPELPVYVELAPGQTISVIPVNWGPNLALQPGVVAASSSGANGFTALTNGIFETWYWGQTSADSPWSDSTLNFPATVEIDLPSVQTIDHVVVFATPPWQVCGTLVDYELQYFNNGQWITIEHVQEPTKTWKVYTAAARSTVDSFFSDRWIFQHAFTPVQTQKIRLLIHTATWGGGATQDVLDAGGQASPPYITLREIEIYNASSVSSTNSTTVANIPPVVSINGPSNNSIYSSPANITLSASALDFDGTISKVEFFANGSKLGEATTAPYNLAWNNVPSGFYVVTARATDNAGATATSSQKNVTVGVSGNVAGPVFGSGTGLTGQYFASVDFSSLKVTRLDSNLNFDWGLGSPDPNIPSDYFAARWTGKIEPEYSEAYTFYTQSDDGCRVWINGQLIIDEWVPNNSTEFTSVPIALQAGQPYDIKVEYFEQTGGAAMKLLWSSASQSKEIIPSAQLYPSQSAQQPSAVGSNLAPTVSLSSVSSIDTLTAPANITLTANASDSDGTIAQVEFYAGTYKIGTVTSAPYTFNWNNIAAGSYTLTAKAYDNAGASTTSNSIAATVAFGPTGNAATYVNSDSTTKGNWKGRYGANGFGLSGDKTAYPSYATVAITGSLTYTWLSSTTDARALIKAISNDRIASSWYSPGTNVGNNFVVDVNLTDGQSHAIELYAVDWDSFAGPRSEKMEVIDATSGVLLDTRTLSNFQGGQYLIWNLTGHVQIRISNLLKGSNALLNGVFFDPASGTTATPSPGSSNNSLDSSGTTAGSSTTTANSSTSTAGSSTTTIGSSTATTTQGSTTTTSGSASDSAATTTTTGTTSTSPTTGDNSAVYLNTDSSTQGNWKGIYGADGFSLSGDKTAYPSYASVAMTGNLNYTWLTSTTDPRAPVKASSSDRVASCWYSSGTKIGNNFVIDVNLTDGQSHSVALYAVDWDSFAGPRSEKVEILDATSGAVLDTRTLSNFQAGQYLFWNLTGHVQFRISNLLNGSNAVVNGLFFGPASSKAVSSANGNSVVYLNTDSGTQGNWKGIYGADGFSLSGDKTAYPSYASVAMTGNLNYTWLTSTTDPRAPVKASSSDRVASCWYSSGTKIGNNFVIDVNLTDGQSHSVALYAVDWDSFAGPRSEKVEILDATSGAVLDTRTLSNFQAGQYLFWNLTGHVQFRISNLLNGSNAVVNGLFFGPASAGSSGH